MFFILFSYWFYYLQTFFIQLWYCFKLLMSYTIKLYLKNIKLKTLKLYLCSNERKIDHAFIGQLLSSLFVSFFSRFNYFYNLQQTRELRRWDFKSEIMVLNEEKQPLANIMNGNSLKMRLTLENEKKKLYSKREK